MKIIAESDDTVYVRMTKDEARLVFGKTPCLGLDTEDEKGREI